MKNKNFKVALDCDDVLFRCVDYAIDRINQREGTNFDYNKITGWGKTKIGDYDIKDEWACEDFWENQPILPGAKEFISKLSKECEIFIATAIDPKYMGIRIRKIMENFPEINPNNVYMTNNKQNIKVDMLLDDGFHNIRNSIANYPVLLRRPWNYTASGVLSVNNYDGFLKLVEIIKTQNLGLECDKPSIIALVGPSGTRKNEIKEELMKYSPFDTVEQYSTNILEKKYKYIDKDTFIEEKNNGKFLGHTMYAGFGFGIKKEEIEEKINNRRIVVLPMDMNGVVTLKTTFKNVISIYIERNREDILENIINRDITTEEKVRRIISLDMERKNKYLCDYTIDGNGTIMDIVKEIREELKI